MNLRGATVLITGASSGIGAATAREVHRRGGRALLVARRKEPLADLAAELGAVAYPCDASDATAVAGLAERVRADGNEPDVLVNNAGAGRFLFLEETTASDLAEMTAVPYFAAFHITRAFIENMLERRSGWIVNVNSPASRAVWPGAIAYSGARWALRGFNAALAVELKGTGVGVTEVVPGKVRSDYFAHNPGSEERLPRISRIIATLTCEDVAAALCAGVERGRRHVLIPRMLRLIDLQARLLPGATEWLLWRTGAKRR